jgi:hypothetical protein
MYDLFVGFRTRLVREEEDDIVGSLVYCFSGGDRPIGDGVGRRGDVGRVERKKEMMTINRNYRMVSVLDSM